MSRVRRVRSFIPALIASAGVVLLMMIVAAMPIDLLMNIGALTSKTAHLCHRPRPEVFDRLLPIPVIGQDASRDPVGFEAT